MKVCLYCGNNFEEDYYHPYQKYCSRKCGHNGFKLQRYGKVNSINPEQFRRWKLLQERGEKCEVCGFEAVNKCQLDIDHIDGNAKNNDFSNLQILCANCHRLKTLMNKDYRERKDKLGEETN